MGIQKIKYRDGSVKYRVQIRRAHFEFDSVLSKKTDADQMYVEKLREAIGLRHPELAQSKKMTFAQFLDIYIARKKSVLKGWDSVYVYIEPEFRAEFGEIALNGITSNDIEDYKAKLQDEDLAPATIMRRLAWLQGIFSTAVKWKYLVGRNPVVDVEKPKINNGRLRFLERAEFARLIEHCADSKRADEYATLRDIVVFAVNTGLRKSELKNVDLRNDVDFARKLLHLPITKNGEQAIIPLNDEAIKILKKQKSARPFDYDFRHAYETAVGHAKLKDVNFHTLRHTFASWLVQQGVSIYTVKELMRHKDIKMTQRYAHLGSIDLAKAVAHLSHMEEKRQVVSV